MYLTFGNNHRDYEIELHTNLGIGHYTYRTQQAVINLLDGMKVCGFPDAWMEVAPDGYTTRIFTNPKVTTTVTITLGRESNPCNEVILTEAKPITYVQFDSHDGIWTQIN